MQARRRVASLRKPAGERSHRMQHARGPSCWGVQLLPLGAEGTREQGCWRAAVGQQTSPHCMHWLREIWEETVVFGARVQKQKNRLD